MKSRREQRHSSIVFCKGKPISFAYNDEGFHAEENALIHDVNYKNMTMINLRLTPAGNIGNSKPCPACFDLLKMKKFRKVIYSTNEGTFEEIIL